MLRSFFEAQCSSFDLLDCIDLTGEQWNSEICDLKLKPPPHAEAQARKKFLALESVQAKPPLVSATNLHMDS